MNRKLAGAYFLGPAVAVDGQFNVLAEINSEIRLVVLDAAPVSWCGRSRWRTVDQRRSCPIRRGARPAHRRPFSDVCSCVRRLPAR